MSTRQYSVMLDYPDGQRKLADYEDARSAQQCAKYFNRGLKRARRKVRGDCLGAVVVETASPPADAYGVDWQALNEQEAYEAADRAWERGRE